MRVTFGFLFGLLITATSIARVDVQDAPTPAATPLAFVGARIVDGTGAPPLADAVMVVQDGKIAAIGRAASVTIPPAATRVNVAGRTIMPGMINAHGHVNDLQGLKASPEFYTPEHIKHQLAVYARYGVTTVFSLGGDGPAGVQVRDERRRVSRASLSQGQ